MFQIGALRFLDVLLNDVHILRRSSLISSNYNSMIFWSNEVSNNIWVVFTKMIVNISDESVSIIDNNTCIRLIHKNDDLFPQWFFSSYLNTRFDWLWYVKNIVDFHYFLQRKAWKSIFNMDDVFHIQFWSLSIWFLVISFSWQFWLFQLS